MFQQIKKILCISITIIFLSQQSLAAMISTKEIVDNVSLKEKITTIKNFFNRSEVENKLSSLGINKNEAVKRVAGLSDQEIDKIYNNISNLPAGQDAFGTVVGAAILIFLILLITDLLGLTHVYPFT